MTQAQSACADAPLSFRRRDADDRRPGLAARLRALYTRCTRAFEDHGDYFAELDRALPLHVREAREARRHRDRLALIATLAR